VQTKLYIDGELTDGLAGRTIDVINPADGTLLAAVAEAGTEDVDRAVDAARRASRAGPRWPPPSAAGS
jgi:acyl-CoA reductase-like NAD-dependent aldehyde dehydrogenase